MFGQSINVQVGFQGSARRNFTKVWFDRAFVKSISDLFHSIDAWEINSPSLELHTQPVQLHAHESGPCMVHWVFG